MRITPLVLAMFISLSAAVALGQDSPAFRAAKEKHDAAIKQADTTYLRALLRAKSVFMRDCKSALDEALRTKDLPTSNAIDKVMKETQAEINTIMSKLADLAGPATKTAVAADKDWQTVRAFKSGEVLLISATGTWCANTGRRKEWTTTPDGMDHDHYDEWVKDAKIGALLGRIGNQTFLIGTGCKVTVAQDADLELRINDHFLSDNDGELTVTVQVLNP